jgi:hypothetical protein
MRQKAVGEITGHCDVDHKYGSKGCIEPDL